MYRVIKAWGMSLLSPSGFTDVMLRACRSAILRPGPNLTKYTGSRKGEISSIMASDPLDL